MIDILRKLKVKWVMKKCRHFCILCKYKNICEDSFYAEYL